MRIAMLGHKRVPSREGGVEIAVEELAVRMVEQGHEVTCLNRRGHHVSGKEYDGVALSEYRGIKLKYVPAIDKKGLAAMTASLCASVLTAFGKYDIVHFHTEGPCVTIWLPKLFGKKCITTVHGLDHQRSKWGKFAKAYILLGEKCAVRWADEIIVLSRAAQDYFKSVYGRETKLIYNGLPQMTDQPAELITEKYGLNRGDYILYLGRITPEKGVHYLIDAFRQSQPDKKLVIAGGASNTDAYFEQLRNQAKDLDNVIFTGFVQGRMLEELYSNAYIYVLPSDLEGMPLSLLEALSHNNCCLVSDIPENRDVVGDCGVTFKKGDARDLAAKIAMLANDEKLVISYRDAVRESLGTRNSWDDVVAQTLNVYASQPKKPERRKA